MSIVLNRPIHRYQITQQPIETVHIKHLLALRLQFGAQFGRPTVLAQTRALALLFNVRVVVPIDLDAVLIGGASVKEALISIRIVPH